jgi:hypothetical protein
MLASANLQTRTVDVSSFFFIAKPVFFRHVSQFRARIMYGLARGMVRQFPASGKAKSKA